MTYLFFQTSPKPKKKIIVIIKEKEDKRKREEFFFSLKVEERTMRTDIFWQFKMGKKNKIIICTLALGIKDSEKAKNYLRPSANFVNGIIINLFGTHSHSLTSALYANNIRLISKMIFIIVFLVSICIVNFFAKWYSISYLKLK